ncbi:hypothetical protein ACWGB8_01575 [Kitasatospora sp. NPDC054939]
MIEFLAGVGAVYCVALLSAMCALTWAAVSHRWRRRQARREAFRDIDRLLKKEARR